MGHMKWIYGMVQDGTMSVYKQLYNNAVKHNLDSFIFESRTHSISYAKGVIDLSVKAEAEYDKHIDRQAEQEQASIES